MECERSLLEKSLIRLLVLRSTPEVLCLFDGTSCKRNIDVVISVCIHVFVLQLDQF